jgi:hypothetical protein
MTTAVIRIHMKRILFFIVALCGFAHAQIPYAMIPAPQACFIDLNGNPAVGGFLYSYAAGTSTQQATYHLDTLGNLTPNTNPVILGANGCAEVRLSPLYYKFVLQQNANSCTPPSCPQVWSVDQVADVGQIVSTQSVLLNPVGAALQTVAGPLAFTTLSLNSGTPLATTNQSGTGNLCMTTNCALVTPSVNSVTMQNSPGAYVSLPNAASGTTLNALAKIATNTVSWTKRNDQSGSGSGSPQTATAFANTLSNPSLIVVLTQGPVGTFSVTDSAGNSYIDCGPGQMVYNSSATGLQCFYAVNTHSTSSNIVSFASTAGGAMKVTAMEWTGGAITSPIDVTQNSGSNVNTGSGGGQNVSSQTAVTTGTDLVIGITGVAAGTLTTGTGFTTSSYVGMEYLTQTGPGSVAATWSDNTNTDPYAAMAIAFRPSPGATSQVTQTQITDAGNVFGVVVVGAGTSGNAVIQQSGTANCLFDGPTSAGDYVINSVSVAGDCHDAGSTIVANQIGRVLSTNASAGTYTLDLVAQNGSAQNPASSGVLCSIGTVTSVSAATSGTQILTTCTFPSGALNTVGKSIRITGNATISPGGSANTTLSYGFGPYPYSLTQTPGVPAATETASANGWQGNIVVTCTVRIAGPSGTLSCTPLVALYSAAGSPVAANYPWVATLNLTQPISVGFTCQFSTSSTSNSCLENQLVVEQLN